MSNSNYPIQTYIQPGLNQPTGVYEQPAYSPIGNDYGQPVYHPRMNNSLQKESYLPNFSEMSNTSHVNPNAIFSYVSPKKQWSEGLCGCLSNIPMCLLGYFCFPCLTNHISWRLDGGNI